MQSREPSAPRRPEFEEGVTIRLSDGCDWVFPVPKVGGYFYPAPNKDGKLALISGFNLGAEYDRLTDRYCEIDPDDAPGRFLVLAEIAFFLLSRNYEISLRDLGAMLHLQSTLGPTLEENRAMWARIGEVALGRSPKPTVPGDAPASSPTA